MLRRELARPSWRRRAIAIGAATDPYQPAEGRFRLTRACIEVLAAAANPFGLITRGPMIVRDIDVLAEAARRAEVSVTFSVPTLDEEVWRQTEPGTAPPRQRLRALSQLVDAGIRASVGMAPILPGISDRPEQLDAVVRAAREAGACGIWANVLYLQARHARALPREPRALLARAPARVRAALRRARLPARDRRRARCARPSAQLARAHGIRDRRPVRLAPPPPPVQLQLEL